MENFFTEVLVTSLYNYRDRSGPSQPWTYVNFNSRIQNLYVHISSAVMHTKLRYRIVEKSSFVLKLNRLSESDTFRWSRHLAKPS